MKQRFLLIEIDWDIVGTRPGLIYGLCKVRVSYLAKGLNFSLTPIYLDYVDSLVNFELFYRNICNFRYFI